ncbi:hypothetical protein [Cohnella zeiphila]|uniref:Uncharacterized protein n=1 Tax=Cohnella zeiphila TaxID=2761120 RepID=A0A7X0SIH1_9BACL|nr:hypothetical protein [Cohnella zeiphila]MBB6730606.1 hypothetical protein [Cohnella zeiphila]
MPKAATLADIKNELKSIIRSNSDRGFLPYGGYNNVCHAMLRMLDDSKASEDRNEAFNIRLYLLIEMVKLFSHADASSGLHSQVIDDCLGGIDEFCKAVSAEESKKALQSILKAAKNKAFGEWEEYGYRLLRSTVHLVQDSKQAEAVYELFRILGPMYGGKEYPDRYLITQGIIERLEGAAAAEKYRMEHLHVPEIRKLVVEEAIEAGQYELAEKLSREALAQVIRHWEPSAWAYDLERIYALTGEKDKQIEIVQLILTKGDRSYYSKLKALFQAEGTWEQQREPILQKLSEAYMSHSFAALLSEENETGRLLNVVEKSPILIEHYGMQLAREYPAETYRIFEAYILNEAAEATDRRKYKGVCKLIRAYDQAGAKAEARGMIQRLIEKYPRRVAMVDELQTLDKKLMRQLPVSD